jgi:hypothetical protein
MKMLCFEDLMASFSDFEVLDICGGFFNDSGQKFMLLDMKSTYAETC